MPPIKHYAAGPGQPAPFNTGGLGHGGREPPAAGGQSAGRPSSKSAATGWKRRALLAAVGAGLASALTGCDYPRLRSGPDPEALASPRYVAEWRVPAGVNPPSATQPQGNALVEADQTYTLPGLIDLALRANPETRQSWEEARAAAARLGRSESAWYPALTALAFSRYTRDTIVIGSGPLWRGGMEAFGGVQLAWLLMDFGAREAAVEASAQRLLAANLGFNRKHQDIAYRVSSRFFAHQSSLARVEAARAVLATADEGVASVQAKLGQGFATRPELLMAVQEQAKANFDLQDALGTSADTQADLAASLGVSPSLDLKLADIGQMPLPSGLEQPAERIVDSALGERPDLAARLAELRARDAEVKKAWAEFWPKLSVQSTVGEQYWNVLPKPSERGDITHSNLYGAVGLTMEWNLFDGFERVNQAKEAMARREAARAELEALKLEVIREIWKAYADMKTALRKREFALALLSAAQASHAAARASYGQGFSTALDLLAAQRDLARARFAEIDSRTSLLQSAVGLVFAAGGMNTGEFGGKPRPDPDRR